MIVRELIKQLLNLDLDSNIQIDAAGRGTYDISEIDKFSHGRGIIVTSSEPDEHYSVHDAEETISQLEARG